MASTSAPTADDLLRDARFTQRQQSTGFGEAPTASSVLSAAVDPSALHPLAGIVDNKDLDYLLLEDDKISGVEGGKSVLPSRGWGDELCYGTGSTYLAGLAAGGLWGLREGIRQPLPAARPRVAPTAAAPAGATAATAAPAASEIGAQARAFAAEASAASASSSTSPSGTASAPLRSSKPPVRHRWNNILNAVTRRGSFAGNSAGVLALIYNAFNSSFDSYRGGKHDIYGSMAAGALTGLVWKSTAGVKPMLVASGVMTSAAAGWSVFKMQFL